MNRAELIREFLITCEDTYKRTTKMPEMLRAAWDQAFDDIHIDRVSRAMTRYLATGKFFPTPADIREIALPLPPNADETAEIEQRRLEIEQRLFRSIEAAKQKQLAAPTRSLLDEPAKPAKIERGAMKQPGPFTEEDYNARMAELQRQKLELLRIEERGKRVTAHAKPIERGVTGAEAEFLLYDPGPEGLVM